MIRRNNNRRISAVIYVLILSVVMTAVSGCAKKGVPAGEKIVLEADNMKTLSEFYSNMKDTVVLYASGATSLEDFCIELEVLKEQYDVIRYIYDKDLEENPIRTGTYDYASKAGMEGLDEMWDKIRACLDSVYEIALQGASPDAVSYQYMAHQEGIVDSFQKYLEAYYEITGENIFEGETDTETEA